MAEKGTEKDPEKIHHEKSNLCYSRPSYREARFERAVKVYTINLESKYIVVSGVASVGVSQELIDKFSLYGNVQEYSKLNDYPTEQFTEAYLIKYEYINNARFAKRKMDNKSFYGGILHVFYAPEYESEQECRAKLEERRKIIARKTKDSSANEVKSSSLAASTNQKSTINNTSTPIPQATPASTPQETNPEVSSYNINSWNIPPFLPSPPIETRQPFPSRWLPLQNMSTHGQHRRTDFQQQNMSTHGQHMRTEFQQNLSTHGQHRRTDFQQNMSTHGQHMRTEFQQNLSTHGQHMRTDFQQNLSPHGQHRRTDFQQNLSPHGQHRRTDFQQNLSPHGQHVRTDFQQNMSTHGQHVRTDFQQNLSTHGQHRRTDFQQNMSTHGQQTRTGLSPNHTTPNVDANDHPAHKKQRKRI